MKFRLAVSATICACALGGCETATTPNTPAMTESADKRVLASGVRTGNFDQNVRPQDDLYRHVNGRWLETTPIPADRSNYGAFTILQDEAEARVRGLLEDAAGTS